MPHAAVRTMDAREGWQPASVVAGLVAGIVPSPADEGRPDHRIGPQQVHPVDGAVGVDPPARQPGTRKAPLLGERGLSDVAPTGVDPVTFRFSVERSTN